VNQNILPSDRVGVVGVKLPTSQAAGNADTGWVSMALFRSAMAVVAAGALGTSATLDAKIQQAQDDTGTGVKDIAGKAITQLTQAASGSNKVTVINVRATDLDFGAGFTHIRLRVTGAVAASLTSAVLLGLDPVHGVASADDAAEVVEIV
jgi:hypothetical protein